MLKKIKELSQKQWHIDIGPAKLQSEWFEIQEILCGDSYIQ